MLVHVPSFLLVLIMAINKNIVGITVFVYCVCYFF